MLKTTTPTTISILCTPTTGQWTIGEIADILGLSDDVLSVATTGLQLSTIVDDEIELQIETYVPQIFESEEWFEAEAVEDETTEFTAVSITPIIWLVTVQSLSDVGLAPDYHAFADYQSISSTMYALTGSENSRDWNNLLCTQSDDMEITVSALPLLEV